jgi:hypothetical protein
MDIKSAVSSPLQVYIHVKVQNPSITLKISIVKNHGIYTVKADEKILMRLVFRANSDQKVDKNYAVKLKSKDKY